MPDAGAPQTATADVVLAQPMEMMKTLCAYFAEHGEVRVEARNGFIRTAFGDAHLEAGRGYLRLTAKGRDAAALAFVKLSLAEHLLSFAAGERPRIVWRGGCAAGSPLPYFREMTVIGARQVTPRMRRITLAGPDLARFSEGGHHVRLLIPRRDGLAPAWPVTGEDGRPSWPADRERPDIRIYTIRRIDVAAGAVDIDFVLHGGDHPGARFARQAAPGMRVGMTGPGGGVTPRADRLLLAGDETALPAIARMLGELPPSSRAVVRIEVADEKEEQPLPSPAAEVDVRWLHRGGAPAGKTTLLENAVRVALPPAARANTFVWTGCEHAGFRAIRRWLRGECRLPRDRHQVAAYWRRGAAGDSARKDDEPSG